MSSRSSPPMARSPPRLSMHRRGSLDQRLVDTRTPSHVKVLKVPSVPTVSHSSPFFATPVNAAIVLKNERLPLQRPVVAAYRGAGREPAHEHLGSLAGDRRGNEIRRDTSVFRSCDLLSRNSCEDADQDLIIFDTSSKDFTLSEESQTMRDHIIRMHEASGVPMIRADVIYRT